MTNAVIASSKPEDGKSIKNVLARNDLQVVAVCTPDGQALSATDCPSGGVAVSGYRFGDMVHDGLRQYLPGGFDIFLTSSPARWDGQCPNRIICLSMSLKIHGLLNTLEMMVQAQERIRKRKRSKPKERSRREQNIITEAKILLMERNNMAESETYRYIQKCSTDSDTNLVEAAQMVISFIHM